MPQDNSTASSYLERLIVDPSICEIWDRIGQEQIQNNIPQRASRYFGRARISDPDNLDVILRLAMAEEISGNLASAAMHYLECGSSHQQKTSRKAIYRAIGCFQKLDQMDRIIEVSSNLKPEEWNCFEGMPEAVGFAYLAREKFSSALEWLFLAPLERDNSQSYKQLLDIALARTGRSLTFDAVCELTHRLAPVIFESPLRSKTFLTWIYKTVAQDQFERLVLDSAMIQRSNGKCLSLIVQMIGRTLGVSAARKWAKQALIYDPQDGPAFLYILPEERELPESGEPPKPWTTLAKATVILPRAGSAEINSAVIVLKGAGQSDAVVHHLIAAADRFAEVPVIQYNVGSHLNVFALAEAAEPILKRALLLQPDYAKALSAYSVSHCIMLHDKEAIAGARRAIASNPDLASAHTNLAMAYRGAGDLPAAISVGEHILQSNPSDISTRMGLAFNQISIGAIELGFENYLCRWAQKDFPSDKRPFPQREWRRGKIPSNRKIIVYMEQGMGDELMFSWFLKYIDQLHPGQILVECDNRLLNLFARSFPTIEFLPKCAPAHKRFLAPDVQFKVPVGHLPHYFTSDLRQLIRDRWSLALQPVVHGFGWLKPDPERVKHWTKFLSDYGSEDRLVVGIAWRSANLARARKAQYVEPSELIESLPEGTLAVNLQYIYTAEEISEIEKCAARRNIDFLTVDGLDLRDDLDDVTNLCGAVDALATPLTSTAFMGGSIGRPTFVFRSSASYNIWQQLGTPHIPWLPSIRVLFRDPRETWDKPICEMRQRLSLVAELKKSAER
jgi:tetratricopeptide (TPR) repeat protein